MNCTDEKLFKSLLDTFPERFEFRCLQINPPFSDKEKLVKKITHHCLMRKRGNRFIQERTQFLGSS